ncbi:M42 family metallopeptidase [Proteiniborus sp.]|uniref:M42 family metallopeptidase n=1 Tax=Proteiniborus sp. TaxID=2079015 RepID=UPI00331C1552
MNIDMKYVIDTMIKYLNIPSPSGKTTEALDEVRRQFEDMGIKTFRTNKGAVIATIEGENTKEHKTISAHIDTIGVMIKGIKPNGRLKIVRVAGGTWTTLEGANVFVETRHGNKYRGTILPVYASTHIYPTAARETLRNEENMEIRLDERVKTKEDVMKLGINPGDYAHVDPLTEITDNGFIKSRYIDDKLAVGMIFGICKYLKDNNIKPKYTINFFISNYEEVGHGVSAVPESTTEFVAIDIGPVGGEQESDEFSVTIAAKDKSTPYDYDLRSKLVEISERNNIDYKVDVYISYGSDASQAIRQGFDFKFACIGPGVDATHHYERTHIKAVENTMKLLINYTLAE